MGVWLAALSGLIGGGALFVGAGVAWFVKVPRLVVMAIMAFGAGVLISTLAFELVAEAADGGGIVPTAAGFLGGAVIYIVAAIAISNIPEGLSSTAAFKQDGSRGRAVALLWGGITAASVVSAVVGYLALQAAPPELIAIITSVAAGALLAMVANTMIPEAFERLHFLTGLWATLGFLLAFVMHELS